MISAWNIHSLLDQLSRHTGNSILFPDEQPISYQRLYQAVVENRNALDLLNYAERADKQVLILDVSIGWMAIPVILSALEKRITVIPVVSLHSPRQMAVITDSFPGEPVIGDGQIDQQGRLRPDQIQRKDIKYFHDMSDVAFILYTSGTTGRPKGVMLTHENIWSNVNAILHYFTPRQDDRVFVIRPLTTASAITGEVLPSLIQGASMYVKPVDQQPLRTASLMGELRGTILCTTPTVALHLASLARRKSNVQPRLLILSGEPLRQHVWKKIREAFEDAEIWNVYGLTEASPRISCCQQIDQAADVNCVGRPLAGVNVKVIDENGETVTDGHSGELVVAGPNVMKGYFNEPEWTALKLKDGWLHTGDRVTMRDGQIYVHGRMDHMIIRSGVNIDPYEVEASILQHPQVTEAMAFGVSDSDMRVRLHVWVVADVEPSDLHRFLIEQRIDSRLWPDVIERKERLPKTSSGKLVRNASNT